MSSRGAYVGDGRGGGGGRRTGRRTERTSGPVSWPALQTGAPNAGGGSSSSPPSDVFPGVSKEMGGKPQAVDVASSSETSVQEKTTKVSGSGLSQELAREVQIIQVTTLPPATSKAVTQPVRPGVGQSGKKIMTRANQFLVQLAERDLYHYDVS